MALEQSYTSQPAGSPQSASSDPLQKTGDYWPLSKLRRCYTDYLFSKREELDEQIDARRYYHGSHWTLEQIKVMKKRRQPVMTFNRVARKINGVVGLIEKLRQDPKAFARTPQHEQGADLATAALRYVLDEQAWNDKSPQVALDGAVDGIGGIEIELVQGDQGDAEVGLETVDIQSFFYDPRSYRDDFSDARYMGLGKWVDEDIAKQMFPDASFDGLTGNDAELNSNSDREMRWFSTDGVQRRVRIVDCWYQHNGGWCYAIFSGNSKLMEGKSYLKDEKGKDICKYVMFSGNVDQDGDRYGFVRNMKSAQDGLNAKQSKMQHILASKRIFISRGAVDDIEKTRLEAARPDGVVIVDRPVNEGIKADDQSFDFAGLSKLLELNIQEIENFGPNPALLGQGLESQSGRAIALLQNAGMAELGPYISSYRGWKIRVYRALWNAIQQHWKGQRWVRVTDDQNLAQYIQINGLQIDPATGQPTLVNAIGSLDVDIILDEGPDHINSMADVYETLSNVLPSIAPVLTPGKAQAVVDILIESSPLPSDVKKRFQEQAQAMDQQQGPPPEVQAMQAKAEVDIAAQKQKAALDGEKMMVANEAKRQSLALDLEHQQKSHELEREHMTHKHEMEAKHMEHKAATTTDLGQVKSIADAFTKSLKEITENKDKQKHVTIERDRSGRVVGATVQ